MKCCIDCRSYNCNACTMQLRAMASYGEELLCDWVSYPKSSNTCKYFALNNKLAIAAGLAKHAKDETPEEKPATTAEELAKKLELANAEAKIADEAAKAKLAADREALHSTITNPNLVKKLKESKAGMIREALVLNVKNEVRIIFPLTLSWTEMNTDRVRQLMKYVVPGTPRRGVVSDITNSQHGWVDVVLDPVTEQEKKEGKKQPVTFPLAFLEPTGLMRDEDPRAGVVPGEEPR